MSAHDDEFGMDCAYCGGEGYSYSCVDDMCVNAEDGCELCMRACEYCNSPRPSQDTSPSSKDETI
jgi:hypothetical protein